MLNETTTKPNSVGRAAARLGLSRPSIYRLIAEGKLRSYCVGRGRRITDEAVDECIELLERETASRRAA